MDIRSCSRNGVFRTCYRWFVEHSFILETIFLTKVFYFLFFLISLFSETLRKYPPGFVMNRICTKDYKVPDSDYTIEKGTPINISVFGLHMDERYFPDPEKFDPDRFTEEQKSSRHHYTYLPFGEGPRVCIGKCNQMRSSVRFIYKKQL